MFGLLSLFLSLQEEKERAFNLLGGLILVEIQFRKCLNLRSCSASCLILDLVQSLKDYEQVSLLIPGFLNNCVLEFKTGMSC